MGWVLATNSAWMTIEGMTTGLRLTSWEEIRRRRCGTPIRLTAIVCFVAGTLLAHEIPSHIILTSPYRPRYVVAMHQAFVNDRA